MQPAQLAHVLPRCVKPALAVLATVMAASCGAGPSEPVAQPNRMPSATSAIPALTIVPGETSTVDVSSYFADPDGDPLTFAAASSNAAVATAAATGSTVTVTGVARGTATITITARDPGGLEATQDFVVTVPNRAPEAVGSISARTLTAGTRITVDMSSHFTDPDGDPLTYSAVSSNAAVATAAVGGSTVTVTGVARGTATITITARDPGGLEAALSLAVEVDSMHAPVTVSLATPAAAAPEGEAALLGVVITPAPTSAISVAYTFGADTDPTTVDADTADYGAVSGTFEIGAGQAGVWAEIQIEDDTDIEPPREVFTVTLTPPGAGSGYTLGSDISATVTIEEGVCDRTPEVWRIIAREIGARGCANVDDWHLARIPFLDLRPFATGDTLTSLKAGDFSGLSQLLNLNLFGNRLSQLPLDVFSGLSRLEGLSLAYTQLTELPEGVFSGIPRLRSLDLSGNELTKLPEGVFRASRNWSGSSWKRTG